MAANDDYAEFVDRLTDQHERRLAQALQVLEADITSIVNDAPQSDGKLFDLEWAVNARDEIRQSIESDFLVTVQGIIDEYTDVAARQITMLNNFGKFTRVAPEAIAGLQNLSFQGFQAIADQQLEVLANGVYQSTITGRSKEALISDLKGSINGVYQQSDDEEARQLVEVAQNSTGAAQDAAVKRLHSIYARDRLGNNMRRYATQMANDSLNQFDAALTKATADEAGIEHFEYYGDLIRDSRPFCRDHVNKVYSLDEINEIWQGDWKGKAPGDPFIVRGGYNCRHRWLPKNAKPEEKEEEQQQEAPVVESVPLLKKAAAKKLLQPKVEKAAQDKRYPRMQDGEAAVRFRARSKKRGETNTQAGRKQFGVYKMPSGMDDQAVSVAVKLYEETEVLATKYGVPNLRGIGGVGRGSGAAANMGDGVLGLNVDQMNRQSAVIFARNIDPEELAASKARLDALDAEIKLDTAAYLAAKKSDGAVISIATQNLAKGVNKKIDSFNNLSKKVRQQEAALQPAKAASTWKFGDDLTERPFTTESYFDDPLDKTRSLFVHEFGHHIHQNYGVTNLSTFMSPPIEAVVKKLFDKKYDKLFPSAYSTTDAKEWFAESFSLYEAGRLDLVDKELAKLFNMIGDGDPVTKIEGAFG